MKVFGIRTTPNSRWGATSRQVRVVVAATSQVKAVEAMQQAGMGNMTVNHLRNYGAVTSNPTEVEVAHTSPGQVFWSEDKYTDKIDDFHPVPRKP